MVEQWLCKPLVEVQVLSSALDKVSWKSKIESEETNIWLRKRKKVVVNRDLRNKERGEKIRKPLPLFGF